MTTLEDMERIALLHATLAIREQGEYGEQRAHRVRPAALAGPGAPGACNAVDRHTASIVPPVPSPRLGMPVPAYALAPRAG